ncbi:TPA: methyltransferase [Pseudomonas aeruginosa]
MLKTLFPKLGKSQPSRPLFTFGTLKLSEKVQWLDVKGLIEPLRYLQRHIRGDWGELSDAERKGNRDALQSQGVLTSRYEITPRLALIIRTNEDRSLTVVQLPEEEKRL